MVVSKIDQHLAHALAAMALSAIVSVSALAEPQESPTAAPMTKIHGPLPTGVTADSARESATLLAATIAQEGFKARGKPKALQLKPGKLSDTYFGFKRGAQAFICVAVPPEAGVRLGARLVEGDREVKDVVIEETDGGWGLTLRFKTSSSLLQQPYMLIVGQIGQGGGKEVPYAIVFGEK